MRPYDVQYLVEGYEGSWPLGVFIASMIRLEIQADIEGLHSRALDEQFCEFQRPWMAGYPDPGPELWEGQGHVAPVLTDMTGNDGERVQSFLRSDRKIGHLLEDCC
jgi:hypothetical protein